MCDWVLDPETGERLRSGPSINKAFIRFFNVTERDVDVLWANYEGKFVRYATLGRQQVIDVNTFEGHPWVFRDRWEGQVLLGTSQSVVQARIHRPLPAQPNHIVRKIVVIHLPLTSLKERSLQAVCRQSRLADIHLLHIPRQLKEELREGVQGREAYQAFHASTDPQDQFPPPLVP